MSSSGSKKEKNQQKLKKVEAKDLEIRQKRSSLPFTSEQLEYVFTRPLAMIFRKMGPWKLDFKIKEVDGLAYDQFLGILSSWDIYYFVSDQKRNKRVGILHIPKDFLNFILHLEHGGSEKQTSEYAEITQTGIRSFDFYRSHWEEAICEIFSLLKHPGQWHLEGPYDHLSFVENVGPRELMININVCVSFASERKNFSLFLLNSFFSSK